MYSPLLVTLFLTLSSAKQVLARVAPQHSSRTLSGESEHDEGRDLTADLSLSLSMPAELAELQWSSSEGGATSSKLTTYLANIMKESSSGSKASKIACSFANPAIAQVFGLDVAPFEYLVFHSLASNNIFQTALEGWLSKELSLDDVEDQGYDIGARHKSFFENPANGFTPPEIKLLPAICGTQNNLVAQMTNTCNFKKRKEDYEIISESLMTGFGKGVGLLPDFNGC